MKQKILLIDDDYDILTNLNELLKDEFNVDFSYSIKDAKKKLEFGEYNLIVSDINLGDGLGVELIKDMILKIKCPVIFMTGSNERDYVKEALKVGAVAFVDKPFKLDEMHRSIYKALCLSNPMLSVKMKKLMKVSI